MVDFEIKDCYKFDDLLRIMEILRAPDGCMWDREQDHHSIRRNFIEETFTRRWKRKKACSIWVMWRTASAKS